MCHSCYQKSPERRLVAKKIIEKRPKVSGKNNPNFKGGLVDLQCRCGKKFKVCPARKDTAKFCSRPCKHAYSVSITKPVIYKNIKFRSRWEVVFAKWLDENNLTWKYEPQSIKLVKGWYIPDFWIEEWQSFAEVKGFWRSDAKPKFEEASKLVPIKLIDKVWFLSQGYIVSPRKGIYKLCQQ